MSCIDYLIDSDGILERNGMVLGIMNFNLDTQNFYTFRLNYALFNI